MGLTATRNKARRAIEKLYEGEATITGKEKYKTATGVTKWRDAVLYSKQPCKLSFQTLTSATNEETMATSISQVVKLIIAPEVVIPEGSKIEVTQNGVTTEYARSGTPAVYATHQEIILSLYDTTA